LVSLCCSFNEKFEVKRLAGHDGEKVKTAGHIPERHLAIHRLAGIVFTEVSVKQRSVTAVKSPQPSLKGATYRSIGNGRVVLGLSSSIRGVHACGR